MISLCSPLGWMGRLRLSIQHRWVLRAVHNEDELAQRGQWTRRRRRRACAVRRQRRRWPRLRPLLWARSRTRLTGADGFRTPGEKCETRWRARSAPCGMSPSPRRTPLRRYARLRRMPRSFLRPTRRRSRRAFDRPSNSRAALRRRPPSRGTCARRFRACPLHPTHLARLPATTRRMPARPRRRPRAAAATRPRKATTPFSTSRWRSSLATAAPTSCRTSHRASPARR